MDGQLPDGRFLVREATPSVTASKGPTTAGDFDTYILTVAYKGKPSHHLIKKNETGIMTVNNKVYGTALTTLEALITQLAQPIQGWPVLLTTPVCIKAVADKRHAAGELGRELVVNINDVDDCDSAISVRPQPLPTLTTELEVTPEATPPVGDAPAPLTGPAGSQEPDSLPFYFTSLSKAAADDMLTASQGAEGTFLLRLYQPGDMNQFVLGVIYNGKPTHHLIKRAAVGAEYTINFQATAATTLAEVVTVVCSALATRLVSLHDHFRKFSPLTN